MRICTRLTGTPDSWAARSLLPVAYSQRPNGVRVNRIDMRSRR